MPGSIRYFQQIGKKYEEAICKLLYGNVLVYGQELATGQKYFLEVYDIFGKIDSFKAQSKVCISIAGLYADMGSMNESSKYYRESYQIAKKYNDSIRQSVALSNLGINYRRSKPDSALLLYKQALSLLPYNATFSRRMKVEFNMANLLLDQNKPEKAAIIYSQLLDYGLKNNSSEVISIAYNGLAAANAAQKNWSVSIEYYQKSMRLMDSLGQVTHLMSLIPEMIELYKHTNDLPKVVALYEQKIKISDSLLNAEKQIAVIELEKKYKAEKKELENKALKTRIRNIQLAILFFSIATIIFFVLWRQRVHLMHERAISYEILMAKYRAEKEVGDKFTHHKTNQLSTTGLVEETLPSDAVLFDQLNAYFETNKPYLDQKLNLATIATGINASQKDINKVLKDNNIASFYAFVNEYRVNEARRLFSNPANNNLKLEVIAEMAGFGTRQTFYSAFLQYTGVTPGYYRKNI
jgi:AraC-like DNA-binding protein